jgi:hypothetical protein
LAPKPAFFPLLHAAQKDGALGENCVWDTKGNSSLDRRMIREYDVMEAKRRLSFKMVELDSGPDSADRVRMRTEK